MSSSTAVPLPGDSGVEEWRELESDPGVFSLLIEDYGVRGVKVEEVYDVSTKFDSEVFGFVFLFRYELSDRRSRKKAREMISETDCYVLDSNIVNKMFFAHQIITNSCATHALLSVLLNCQNVDIGPSLAKLKDFTQGLDPESKGFAIANMMELAHIHNKHARPPRTIAPPIGGRKHSIVSSAYALLPETYHFVSFVPINGRLFELDGLKEFPIDHGPWGEHERWTDLFQRIVTVRLVQSQDFLFNLMALTPDPLPQISEHLKSLHSDQTTLLDTAVRLARQVNQGKEQQAVPTKQEDVLTEQQDKPTLATSSDQEMVKEESTDCTGPANKPSLEANLLHEVSRALPAEAAELDIIAATPLDEEMSPEAKLRVAVAMVVKNHKELETYKKKLKEEVETKQRFRVEHSRRIHDYDPFIFDFVKCLAHNKQLPERLLRRPSVALPLRNGNRNKGKRGGVAKKPRTTLLLNGNEVS